MISAVGLGEIAIHRVFVPEELNSDTFRRAWWRNQQYFDSYFTTSLDGPSNADLGLEGDCKRGPWSSLSVHANAPQAGAGVCRYEPS